MYVDVARRYGTQYIIDKHVAGIIFYKEYSEMITEHSFNVFLFILKLNFGTFLSYNLHRMWTD